MCSAITNPTMTTFAPFQQLPQPVASMSSKPKRKRSFEDEPDEEQIMGLDATKVSTTSLLRRPRRVR
jgi:hypothetical protein